MSAELIACNAGMFEDYVDALKEFINREKLLRNLNTITAKLKDGVELNKIYSELTDLKAD